MHRRPADLAECGPAPVPPPLEVAGLRAHPRFEEAMRTATIGFVRLHGRNRALKWFLSDRALAVLGYAALYLDADARDDDPRSGLTPGRFKNFCAETRLCSAGRAAAILAFMRILGHVEADANPVDRRVTRLRPSPRLIEVFRARYRVMLGATAMICPEVVPAVERIGDRDFERAMCRAMGDRFLAGGRLLHHAPQLRMLTDRDAGLLMVMRLSLDGPEDGPMPPVEPVPLSIAALARQFQVSRTHVLRLIRDGDEAGLLMRSGVRGEEVRFAPELREGLMNFLAAAFQFFGASMLEALAQQGARDQRRSN